MDGPLVIIIAVVPCWAGQDQEVLKKTYRDMLKVNSGLKRDPELEKIAQSICGCVFDHGQHKRQSHRFFRSELLKNSAGIRFGYINYFMNIKD